MKKLLSVLLALCMIAGCAYAGTSAFAAYAKANQKTTVIVKTEEDAVLSTAAFGELREKAALRAARFQEKVKQAIEDKVCPIDAKYSYTYLFNGFSAEVREKDIEKILSVDGVKAVYKTDGVKPAAEQTGTSREITSGKMIGLDSAREMGYDGTGTALAIIDGGFNIKGSTVRLSDDSTAKLSKKDIADVLKNNKMNCGDFTADELYVNAKVPFAFDYCENDTELNDFNRGDPNHGSHVLGIAAGNSDRLAGIAPEAQVLLFKVDVYIDDDFLPNLLAAIDDAAKFDIASINISLGIDLENPSDPAYDLLQEATSNARKSGILVCTAAGNAGRFSNSIARPDSSMAGIPNSFDGSTSVASVDNIYLSEKTGVEPGKLHYGKDRTADILAYGIYIPFPEDEVEFVPMGKNGTDEDLSGKCALIYREQDDYSKVFSAILESDAAGVIMSELVYYEVAYSEKTEDLFANLLEEFGMIILYNMDAYRLAHTKDRTVHMEYSEGFYTEPADILRISDYSSWGISDDAGMTVDIAAPGGVIFSSVASGQYEIYDGTSMASPHICGAGALVEQHFGSKGITVEGEEKADLKESLIKSTADPIAQGDALVPVRVAGAGLINLERAFSAKAVLTGENNRTALNLGDNLSESFDITFTVKNFSDTQVKYDTVSVDICTDAYETTKVFNQETGEYDEENEVNGETVFLPFEVTSDPGEIVLGPGESKEITVSVAGDAETFNEYKEVFYNGFFLDGYLYLTDSQGENTDLNMPLLGFAGDWDAVPAVEILVDGINVVRSLRELRFELVDADGKVVAEEKTEDIKKGNWYSMSYIEDIFGDAVDGEYELKVYAVPVAAEEEQEYSLGLHMVDNTLPEIVSVKKKRNSDGSGTITITAKNDNIDYFEITGATIFNYTFKDIYPVDGYDSIDDNGDYVYVIYEDELPFGGYVIDAVERSGMFARHGSYSFLVIFITTIKDYFDMLRFYFTFIG